MQWSLITADEVTASGVTSLLTYAKAWDGGLLSRCSEEPSTIIVDRLKFVSLP